jgi:hypothetical protein
MARRRLRARVNWALRWAGLTLCLLMLTAWIVSSFRRIAIEYECLPERDATLQVNMGQLGLSARWGPSSHQSAPVARLVVDEVDESLWTSLLWKFRTENLGRGERWLYWRFPLWPLLIIVATVASVALIRYRAIRPGLCPSCNYDLCGLPPGSPCPECATHPPNY